MSERDAEILRELKKMNKGGNSPPPLRLLVLLVH